MTKRITDLEKFALEQIWRPYQNREGFAYAQDRRFESLPASLEETAKLLAIDETGWAKCVLDRIVAVGFTFPSYIKHELVDVVTAAQDMHRRQEKALAMAEGTETGR